MKLLTYICENTVSFGVLTENGIVDIGMCWAEPDRPRSVKQVLARGADCLGKLSSLVDSADTFIPLSSVKLLAPIPNPGKLLALAGNYSKHIIEAGLKLGLSDSLRKNTVPRPFLMPPTVVCRPGGDDNRCRHRRSLLACAPDCRGSTHRNHSSRQCCWLRSGNVATRCYDASCDFPDNQ